MNAADRLASNIQRNNIQSVDFEFIRLDDGLKRKLVWQLREHFALHGLDVGKLRKLIERSRLLESIPADKSDANRSTLRAHLLMTEDVLRLLLEIPQPKSLAQWVKTRKVRRFVAERLKPIKPLDVIRITPNKTVPDQRMRNALEFALENGWNEARIAMELCLTLEDVRRMLAGG